MSNASGSSGTSNARQRGRFLGVPNRCWCGEAIVAKISKSDSNPYRRYYRCGFAAMNKLSNDNHIFKWVDEALVDELEAVSLRLGSLEESANQLISHNAKIEEMEKAIVDRVDEELVVAIADSEYKMKKVLALVVVCFVITFAILKLVD